MYELLYEHMFLILVRIYLGLQLLGYIVILHLLTPCQIVFYSGLSFINKLFKLKYKMHTESTHIISIQLEELLQNEHSCIINTQIRN